MGSLSGFPGLRTLRHRHSQARRRRNRHRFPPQLTQRVLQKTRLRRSELADLIHVLLTPFNNHYFTLTDITDSTDITDITDYTDNTDLADFNDYMVAGGLF